MVQRDCSLVLSGILKTTKRFRHTTQNLHMAPHAAATQHPRIHARTRKRARATHTLIRTPCTRMDNTHATLQNNSHQCKKNHYLDDCGKSRWCECAYICQYFFVYILSATQVFADDFVTWSVRQNSSMKIWAKN